MLAASNKWWQYMSCRVLIARKTSQFVRRRLAGWQHSKLAKFHSCCADTRRRRGGFSLHEKCVVSISLSCACVSSTSQLKNKLICEVKLTTPGSFLTWSRFETTTMPIITTNTVCMIAHQHHLLLLLLSLYEWYCKTERTSTCSAFYNMFKAGCFQPCSRSTYMYHCAGHQLDEPIIIK